MPWKQFFKQRHEKSSFFFQISDYFSDKELALKHLISFLV